MATLKSLLYLSNGNLPSKMAHTIQVAKMAQALSQQLENFELVTGGDLRSAFTGMDGEFQNWYGLHRHFKLVRLPTHIKVKYPFPQDYQSYRYFKLVLLYACLKSPSLVFTRSTLIADRLLKIGVPVLWEKHELIDDNSSSRKFFADKNFIGFVTISQRLADRCINSGLSPEKVLVAHSGVDVQSFLPYQEKHLARQKLSLPQAEKIILYSGHLYEYKGIPTLLETARMMPECRFVLVGGWVEDIDRVKQECNKLNLHNVQLVGHVTQTELASYLYAADVLIVPTSKYWHLGETTSPLKLFEYMVVKRPIVASALPTIMTVLRDRENALLAEPDEPLSFKDAIANLLENPILANNIAERAFQEVQNFTWDKRAKRIVEFSAERLKEVDRDTANLGKNLIRYLQQNLRAAFT
ncbi:group 1 glycosyl transferase [Hydrococcus rivularis NIES-593]|uniref:Group 1 glycosyl transferase n=1 Tax=Hydrococcus rivularis NIES-593 TaxID=1921803 RepID=A0A1U7HLJ0_9CYAN|nr:glycosyltransferase [Hydrococcus rivularis]OKH24470.1 group 1 glycosyl transferase [Hydrococcus rivularis NIES-593]